MYKNLKALRESLGMNQKEFAESLGILNTTYNGYENGSRDPKSDFWMAVAQKYGVTIDYLMGFSDDPKKTSPSVSEPTQEDAARKLNVNEVINAFVSSGMVGPGEDLTDDDLQFLIKIIDFIRFWFSQKQKKGS